MKRKAKQILVVLVLPILTISSLTSCSSVKRLEVSTTAVERVPLVLPEVDVLKLERVDWYVVTQENLAAVLDELDKKGHKRVVFGTTDKGYEILSVNMAKIQKLVRQQKAIIVAYKEFYEKQQTAINTAVNENNRVNDEIKKHNENVDAEESKSLTTKLGDKIKKIF